MKCKKCGSENVQVQAVTTTKTKHRGCLGWSMLCAMACTGASKS